jgi:hypothetical protein
MNAVRKKSPPPPCDQYSAIKAHVENCASCTRRIMQMVPSLMGKTSSSHLTPAQRKARAKEAAAARWRKQGDTP